METLLIVYKHKFEDETGSGLNCGATRNPCSLVSSPTSIDQWWMNPLARAELPHTNKCVPAAEVYLIWESGEELQQIAESF